MSEQLVNWNPRKSLIILTLMLIVLGGFGVAFTRSNISAHAQVPSLHLIRVIRGHQTLTIRLGGGRFGPLGALYTFSDDIWTDETPGGTIYGVGGDCVTSNNPYADTYYMACHILKGTTQKWNQGTPSSLVRSSSHFSQGTDDISASSGSGKWTIEISAVDESGGSVISTSNINEQNRSYVGWNLTTSFTI